MTESQKSFISSKAVIPDSESDFQTWMKFLSRLNFFAKWHEVLKQMRVLRDLVKDSIVKIDPVFYSPIPICIEDEFNGVTVKTNPLGFAFYSEVFYQNRMVDFIRSSSFEEALRTHKKLIRQHKHHLRIFKMRRVISNILGSR